MNSPESGDALASGISVTRESSREISAPIEPPASTPPHGLSKEQKLGTSERGASRLERRNQRDRARGYSLNIKQVVLAFAVEFMIIGLTLTAQYFYAADVPGATTYIIAQALLFPIAMSMIELARVPLAIAVRTQRSWNIKFAALIGVLAAVVVTSSSLSNIGYFTFNPRLQDAQEKQNRLTDALGQRQAYLDQVSAEQAVVDQKLKEREDIQQTYQKLASNYTAQQGQTCGTVTGTVTTTQDTGTTQTQTQRLSCKDNPALKLLQSEVAATKSKLSEAEAAIKEEQKVFSQFDRKPFDDKVSQAEADYRTAVYRSQLHSYTAMLFHKDAQEVTAGEIKTLEGFLIWIPSIAAALSSTLIAMAAVHRIAPSKPESETMIPDEAVAYLFGPLVDAIRKEATDAVHAAMGKEAKEPPPLGAATPFRPMPSGVT